MTLGRQMQHSSNGKNRASDRRPPSQSDFGTVSVCARCTKTGDLGFATLSNAMAAGAFLGLVRHGAVTIAAQGAPNPYLKFWIAGALLAGKSVDVALKEALKRDPNRKLRQVIVVDKNGKSAGHTGRACVSWSGHLVGDDFAIAGHDLDVETVVQKMAATFKQSRTGGLPLADRLLLCLESGHLITNAPEAARAAALTISGPEGYQKLDLRIDDHRDPLAALHTLYTDYNADDLKVDRFLARQSAPGGQIPTQMDEALIYLRRYWLQTKRKMGLTKSANDTSASADHHLIGSDPVPPK
jgi:uncharacterized Ntn-hydrolase superfamily protein